MTTMTNSQRSRRAARCITNYGEDVAESNLIDFLADAMHWCRQYGQDFEGCLRLAREHFEREAHGNTPVPDATSELLAALSYLLEQTVDMDLKYGNCLSEGEEDARAKALTAIAKATAGRQS